MKRIMFGVVAFCLCAFPAQAAIKLNCSGTVKSYIVGDWQGLYITGSWDESSIRICDLDGSWQGVPQEVCKAWFSMVQYAKLTGSDINVLYEDSGYTDCASLPAGSVLDAPRTIRMNE